MRSSLRAWRCLGFIVLLGVLSFPGLLHAADSAESHADIRILGYARVPNVAVALDAQEMHWLAEHSTLTVGIVPNDQVPFDILGLAYEYEGVSADYLAAVTTMLHLNLHIKTFRSVEEGTRALAAGEIDVLPTMQGQPASGMVRSVSYFPVRHVEVPTPTRDLVRHGEIIVGYVSGHVPVDVLAKAYPRARLVAYGSVFLGLTAALAGKVDVFVENGTSATYLIDQYQLSALRPANFSEEPVSFFHFWLRTDDPMRLRLINKALAAIPQRTHDDIKSRWSPTYEATEAVTRINLSERERNWITGHPIVHYATTDDRMPFIFADSEGRFRGLSIEVMNLIASRTGLEFQPALYRREQGSNEVSASIDLLPVAVRGTSPLGDMVASNVYFQGYWVVISRNGDPDVLRVEDLAGKRIAYLPPNGVVERIKERIPSVKLIPVHSFSDSYEQVAIGHADVTIGNINTASYFLQKSYSDRLKVAGAIDDAPIDVAFGIRADAPELLSIVNKALESISPEEMRHLRANWMFLSSPSGIDWRRYYPLLAAVAFGVLGCIGLFAMWNRSLQKQVRRRETAERELQEQLAFQFAMLDGIPHPIAVRDQQTRLIHCNTAFERLFGATREDMRASTLLEGGIPGLDPENTRHVQANYERVLADGKPISEDLDFILAGETRKMFHWVAPISREDRKPPVAVISGLIDVQERYHLLDLIESARAKAEAANRAKSNFLATMSHEIRTPMNAVMGVFELLVREGQLNAQDQKSVELAQTSAQALLGLIDDILDISKIEAGGLEIVSRSARLRPIVEEVARVFESLARQRGLSIHVEIDSAVSEWHNIDAARFRQIVNNLVSNAIKYTDAGHVWLRLHHLDEVDEIETVELEVEDTGIGIASQDLENLFKPFFQAEAAGPRTVGGTGLGLPIVQRLCHRMGGEITIDSEPGKGTRARVIFRLIKMHAPESTVAAPSMDAAEPPQWRAQRARFRILVVDDHLANRLLLERQLAFLGFPSVTAENGEEALALWRSEKFDLVITDCSMPIMDGYALTTAIRAQEVERRLPPSPVLGCTAHVQEEERRHAIDVGMDECLMKPIGVDALLEALKRHLPSDEEGVPLPESVPAARPADEPFDSRTLHSFSGGNEKIESEFLDALLRTNLSDIQELEELAHSSAFREAAACAHKIKGALRIIKAEEAIYACEAVEAAARSENAWELAQKFEALKAPMSRLNQAISVHLQNHCITEMK